MIKNDDKKQDDLVRLIEQALANLKKYSKTGAASYICFPWRTYSEFQAALENIGINIAACIVWNKGSMGLGQQQYRPQHEFIFYCKGAAWYGDRSQSDVWTMSRGNTADYVHPTQKPVELIERALINSSKEGDIIADCFGGSGSTLIACEKNNRHAYLMELDPVFCDTIVARWEQFTGKKAIHEATGKGYNDLCQTRRSQ